MSLTAIKWKKISETEAYAEVIDQLLLPFSNEYIKVRNTTEGCAVIKKMQVRGAPLIAITGCLSLAAELVNHEPFVDKEDIHGVVNRTLGNLISARPTAVNIKVAADELIPFSDLLKSRKDISVLDHKERIIEWCIQMLEDDVQANKQLGKFGSEEILTTTNAKRVTLLTHCNTGSLATAGYGTALGVVRSLFNMNCLDHVYFTETRPYLQGARLTAHELNYEKIPSTLICDSAAAYLMKRIDAVVVGADRIARNGDTANKIGTCMLALAARRYQVPFYVCARITTIDFSTNNFKNYSTENRNSDEVTIIAGKQITHESTVAWNPAFDVTEADLITAFITEKGVFKPDELCDNLNC